MSSPFFIFTVKPFIICKMMQDFVCFTTPYMKEVTHEYWCNFFSTHANMKQI